MRWFGGIPPPSNTGASLKEILVGHWDRADDPSAGAHEFQSDGVAVVALGTQKLTGAYTINDDNSVAVKGSLPGGGMFNYRFTKVQATKTDLTLTDEQDRTLHFKRPSGDTTKPPDKPKGSPSDKPKDPPVVKPKDQPPAVIRLNLTSTVETKPPRIAAATLSADGTTLVTACSVGGIQVWGVLTGMEWKAIDEPAAQVRLLALGADGKTLVTDAKQSGDLRSWSLPAGLNRGAFGSQLSPSALTFMPGGKLLAVGCRSVTPGKPDEHRVVTIDPTTTRRDKTIVVGSGDGAAILCLACSPDGKSVAVGRTDGLIKIFTLADGAETASLAGHDDLVTALAFSGDGKTLVSGGADKSVRVWDVEAKAVKAVCQGHAGAVTCVAASADGKLAASGEAATDGKAALKLWEAESGKERASVAAHDGAAVAVCFTPDGKGLITAGDKTLKYWSVDSLPGQNSGK
jgi:WD40 repeat protein